MKDKPKNASSQIAVFHYRKLRATSRASTASPGTGSTFECTLAQEVMKIALFHRQLVYLRELMVSCFLMVSRLAYLAITNLCGFVIANYDSLWKLINQKS